MYQLDWAPDFTRKKTEILAMSRVPDIAVPREIEEALQAASARPDRLWRGCFIAVRRLLLKSAFASFVSAVCASVAALIGMEILKFRHDLPELLGLSCAFFGANILATFAACTGSRLRTLTGLGVEAHLAASVSIKTARLSARAAATFSKGNLKILVTSDVRTVGELFDNMARNLLPALTAALVVTPLIYRFTGRAGLVGLAVLLLMLPFSAALSAFSARFRKKEQQRSDVLTSLIGEWVRNIRLVRFLSWQDIFKKEIAERVRDVSRASVVQHFMLCLLFGVSFSSWMIAVAAIPISAKWMGIETDLIRFFGSIWLISLIHASLQHVPNTVRIFGQASVSMKRIRDLLSAEELEQEFLPASAIPDSEARPVALVLEGTGFDPSPGVPALEDLNLRLRRKNGDHRRGGLRKDHSAQAPVRRDPPHPRKDTRRILGRKAPGLARGNGLPRLALHDRVRSPGAVRFE